MKVCKHEWGNPYIVYVFGKEKMHAQERTRLTLRQWRRKLSHVLGVNSQWSCNRDRRKMIQCLRFIIIIIKCVETIRAVRPCSNTQMKSKANNSLIKKLNTNKSQQIPQREGRPSSIKCAHLKVQVAQVCVHRYVGLLTNLLVPEKHINVWA